MLRGMMQSWLSYGGLIAASAGATYALIKAFRPLLSSYALARPNARSSHSTPTPQGGGIAVVATTLVASGICALLPGSGVDPSRLAAIVAVTAGLAVVGTTDDLRPLDVLPRLLLQLVAVVAMVAALPAGLHPLPMLPGWLEMPFLIVGSLWFVNLVNFMDGIDWMTVAETVPVTAVLSLFGAMGGLPADGLVVALSLCGAMIGFAPFNRPVARLFLGDVGSLPVGLLIAWLLILLAGSGHLASAVLLPLYYVADATLTLLQRLVRGEPVTQAHRSHYYQRALANGWQVRAIVAHVATVNIALACLATVTFFNSSRPVHVAAVAAGCALVAGLLWRFAGTRSRGGR